MSHIMRSCWTEETFVCIFCKSPSESIHHSALLYFIVCLNTSPHGKLGAETSMEKMTRVTTQGILEREGGKKNLRSNATSNVTMVDFSHPAH